MAEENETVDVMRSIWADKGTGMLPEDCGPKQNCRNGNHFNFEGLAEPGMDLATAWRDLLQREGKASGTGSIGDLVNNQ